MRITLKEIAKIANVSRGTVDKVIHNRKGVSDETRTKVKEIIEKQKYEPSKAGKLLASFKKEITVAVISIFSEDKDYFSLVREGIEEGYNEIKQYTFFIKDYFVEKNSEELLFKLLNEIIKEKINAIILPPYNSEKMRDFISEISAKGIYIVTYSTDIANTDRLFFVGNDYYSSGVVAASLMAKSLRNTGDIVVFEGDAGIKCHQDRLDGFINYITEHFPKINIAKRTDECQKESEYYLTTKKIFSYNNNIKGIFIISRGVSGIISALKEINLPETPKIVTFDIYNNTKKYLESGDIDFVVDQDPKEQGRLIITTLFEYLFFGNPIKKDNIYTPMGIYIKENM